MTMVYGEATRVFAVLNPGERRATKEKKQRQSWRGTERELSDQHEVVWWGKVAETWISPLKGRALKYPRH
jgi:hypothetical protein